MCASATPSFPWDIFFHGIWLWPQDWLLSRDRFGPGIDPHGIDVVTTGLFLPRVWYDTGSIVQRDRIWDRFCHGTTLSRDRFCYGTKMATGSMYHGLRLSRDRFFSWDWLVTRSGRAAGSILARDRIVSIGLCYATGTVLTGSMQYITPVLIIMLLIVGVLV